MFLKDSRDFLHKSFLDGEKWVRWHEGARSQGAVLEHEPHCFLSSGLSIHAALLAWEMALCDPGLWKLVVACPAQPLSRLPLSCDGFNYNKIIPHLLLCSSATQASHKPARQLAFLTPPYAVTWSIQGTCSVCRSHHSIPSLSSHYHPWLHACISDWAKEISPCPGLMQKQTIITEVTNRPKHINWRGIRDYMNEGSRRASS